MVEYFLIHHTLVTYFSFISTFSHRNTVHRFHTITRSGRCTRHWAARPRWAFNSHYKAIVWLIEVFISGEAIDIEAFSYLESEVFASHPRISGHNNSSTPKIAESLPSKSSSLPRPFKCSVCKKDFPRRCRAETCENRHQGVKAYACQQECGLDNWYVTMSSFKHRIDSLSAAARHFHPKLVSVGTACRRSGAIGSVKTGTSADAWGDWSNCVIVERAF